jgi:hypothetical protein
LFCWTRGGFGWQQFQGKNQLPSQQRPGTTRRFSNNKQLMFYENNNTSNSRRQILTRIPKAAAALIVVTTTTTQSSGSSICWARTPGSQDLSESIEQIQDAVKALRALQTDWNDYATIDAEGRAGSTDAARRILGGIAPQSGTAAIETAKVTPLYRIDGAFKAIRTAAIDDTTTEWVTNLDLLKYEELVDRVLFAIQKADGDFYSVLFAAKGTKQISGIYEEAKNQVDQCIVDLQHIMRLFEDAGAPGL